MNKAALSFVIGLLIGASPLIHIAYFGFAVAAFFLGRFLHV